jgi:N6-adenosine-specific RNA methylase IME4
MGKTLCEVFAEEAEQSKYRTILADPPWAQQMIGKYKTIRNQRPEKMPYSPMSLDEIMSLDVGSAAAPDCHLWLWTTNQFLEAGLQVMRSWGFKYLAPILWNKPSGIGNYFVQRTQTVLFGYRKKCVFPLKRYAPNIMQFPGYPKRHSEKPRASYKYIESISPGPRLELFGRKERDGWDVIGNEIDGLDIRESLRMVANGEKPQPAAMLLTRRLFTGGD